MIADSHKNILRIQLLFVLLSHQYPPSLLTMLKSAGRFIPFPPHGKANRYGNNAVPFALRPSPFALRLNYYLTYYFQILPDLVLNFFLLLHLG
jgi:hypothetical protein